MVRRFVRRSPSASCQSSDRVFVSEQVDFEDVLAEPGSTHSFDRVWICSHAAFELLRFIFYRLLTTLLAVPLAFTLGLMFATLSCVHIW